ncbi:hypothetical protein D3C87_300690 [compost metagenome]
MALRLKLNKDLVRITEAQFRSQTVPSNYNGTVYNPKNILERVGSAMSKIFVHFGIALLVSFFYSLSLASSSAGITYNGRLVGPSGNPVEGIVEFRLQIRTPNTGNCLLFQETKTLNMTGKNGYFTLTLNDGNGVILTGSYALDRVFANQGKFEVTHPNLDCGGSTDYIPNTTDGRKLKVAFKDSTLNDWEQLPTMDINFVPTAIESVQVGGFKASHLLRVQDASGSPQTVTAFSPTEFTALLSLIDGTSNAYLPNSSVTGIPAPVVAGNPASAAAGSVWFDSVTGKLKYHDGSTVQTLGTSGGSVNSVAAGTGLVTNLAANAPITATGSLSIADSGVDTLQLKDGAVTSAKMNNSGVTAGVYGSAVKIPVITVDAQGRLTLASEANITGLLPSGTNGEFLKSNGSAWSSSHIEVADIKSTGVGHPSFFNFTAACTLEKTLVYDSINDRMNCTAIGINANQVTAGTLDKARLPSEAILDGGNAASAAMNIGSTTAQNLNFITGNAARMTVDSTGKVGIGTTSPQANLHLLADANAPNNMLMERYNAADVTAAGIEFKRSRGTAASPSAVLSGDSLGMIYGRGYGATGYASASRVRLTMYAGENWTDTAQGSGFLFETTASGTTSRSEKMRLDPSGYLGIGTLTPQGHLHVKSNESGNIFFEKENAASIYGASMVLQRSRSSGLISATDHFGQINFRGHDGSAFVTGALIRAQADGTPAAGEMPGQLSLWTTPVGGSQAQRITIRGDGRVGIGTTTPSAVMQIKAGGTVAGTSPLKFTSGGLLGTPEDGAVEYDGTDLYFTSGSTRRKLASTSGGSLSEVGSIVGSGALNISAGGTNQNLVLAGSGTGQVQASSIFHVTNNTASTSTTTGAMIVDGGLGVSGAVNAGSLSATTSLLTPVIYGSDTASGSLTLQGTSHATPGDISVNPNGGSIKFGTNSATSSSFIFSPSVTAQGFMRMTSDANANFLQSGVDSSVGSAKDFRIGPSFTTVPWVTFAANGSVGVGTTSPISQIHVQNSATSGTVSDNADILVKSVNRNATLSLDALSSSGTAVIFRGSGTEQGRINYDLPSNSFRFNTAASERMRIDSSGHVGIGTSTPLHGIGYNANSRVLSVAGNGTNVAGSYGVITIGNNRTTPASNDNIGILDFVTSNGAGSKVGARLISTSQGTGGASGFGANMSFQTKADNGSLTERFRINNDGNIGVGTTAPISKFTVNSNANVAQPMNIYLEQAALAVVGADATKNRVLLDSYGATSYLSFRRAGGTAASPTATVSGNILGVINAVGYGATDYAGGAASISLRATEAWSDTANGSAISFETTANGSASTTVTERMRIDHSGNVGIGTTAPSEKLEISGGNLKVVGVATCVLGTASGGVNCTSDARLKDNVKPIPYALYKIMQLRGVEFDWNQKASGYGRHDIGVIAQEVEKVFPTLIHEDKATGYKMVDYASLVSPLIESTKELYGMCKATEQKVNHLEREIASLKEENLQIKQESAELKKRLEQQDKLLSEIKTRLGM